MRAITLTMGKVAMVDDADYEYLSQFNWYANKIKGIWYALRGQREPKISKGVYGKVKRIYMHRTIMGVTDRWQIIDHIDHNGLNNQRSNLRVVTHSENIRHVNPNKIDMRGKPKKYRKAS